MRAYYFLCNHRIKKVKPIVQLALYLYINTQKQGQMQWQMANAMANGQTTYFQFDLIIVYTSDRYMITMQFWAPLTL